MMAVSDAFGWKVRGGEEGRDEEVGCHVWFWARGRGGEGGFDECR